MTQSAKVWLNNEDKKCHSDRLKNIKWIIKNFPNTIEIMLFHGGLKSKYLFEEARYCFIYGQYIASIMLSLSFIENTIASVFYASGRNDLQRANLIDLLKKAEKEDLITKAEFAYLIRLENLEIQ